MDYTFRSLEQPYVCVFDPERSVLEANATLGQDRLMTLVGPVVDGAMVEAIMTHGYGCNAAEDERQLRVAD